MIILFVTLVLYLGVGIGINKFQKGATGSDMIPNRTFWSALPGLMQDGIRFLAGAVGGKKKQYEPV